MAAIKPRDHQQGDGLLIYTYIALTIGLIGLIVFYSIPVYLTAYDVNDALQGVAHDKNLKRANASVVQNNLRKRLHTNDVRGIKAKDLKIVSTRNGRKLILKFNMERHLFYNIGIHYHFKKTAVLPSS